MDTIIFIGIQASGKSLFYRQRFFDTHLRINLDMLRTRRRENILFRACLEAGQRLVVDNTNLTASDRERYILPSKAAHFTVTGYFFLPDPQAALARNELRTGRARVPARGILGAVKRLQPPTPCEGFDALYLVETLPDERFLVREYCP